MTFNTDHSDAKLFEIAVESLDHDIADVQDLILDQMTNMLRSESIELLEKLTKLVESRKHIVDLAQQHLPPW